MKLLAQTSFGAQAFDSHLSASDGRRSYALATSTCVQTAACPTDADTGANLTLPVTPPPLSPTTTALAVRNATNALGTSRRRETISQHDTCGWTTNLSEMALSSLHLALDHVIECIALHTTGNLFHRQSREANKTMTYASTRPRPSLGIQSRIQFNTRFALPSCPHAQAIRNYDAEIVTSPTKLTDVQLHLHSWAITLPTTTTRQTRTTTQLTRHHPRIDEPSILRATEIDPGDADRSSEYLKVSQLYPP